MIIMYTFEVLIFNYFIIFIDSKHKEQKIIKDAKKSSDRESKQLLLCGTPVSVLYFLFFFIC